MMFERKRKLVLSSFLSLLLFLMGIYLVSYYSKRWEDKIILFYGEGCPHCALVEEFIKSNNILAKMNIEEKEVYYDKSNASELLVKARECGLLGESIGVPFLWYKGECIVGDMPIINFLKGKLSL